MNVYAEIVVETRLYYRQLPLTEVSGLHNVVTGKTTTNRIVTGNIGIDLEKTCTRIGSLKDLAVDPVLTISCSVCYGTDADLATNN